MVCTYGEGGREVGELWEHCARGGRGEELSLSQAHTGGWLGKRGSRVVTVPSLSVCALSLSTQAMFVRTTLSVLAASMLATSADAGAVELNAKNFDEKISGKGAFIKFLAPW